MTADNTKCPVCRATGSTRPFMTRDATPYLRCHRCLATFVAHTHLPNAKREYTHYLSHENDIFDARYRAFLKKLADPLLKKLPPNSHGLDYGCGPGPALAQLMIEAGHTMDIYDPFFAPNLPHATTLPPGNPITGQYDFITCTETAEHFHAPADEFEKLNNLLRPGAWLGLMTCFQDNDARFVNWHYRKDPTHVVFYKQETLERIAKDLGWNMEIAQKDVALMQKPPSTTAQ